METTVKALGSDSPAIRHDWSLDQALSLFQLPLTDLLERARRTHEIYADKDVQQCMLLSVKTGGCPENCGYCSQSAHFKTTVDAEPILSVDETLVKAREARQEGATRFCMGAAWRQIPEGQKFEQILQMVKGVSDMGMEVCCTLGMATETQLVRMKGAGLTAYNHNLDTSREHYDKVVNTRTYDDRLETLRSARRAGVQLCCGGILGMGEAERDRAALLVELSTMNPHPESVPVNLLVPIEGTPMQDVAPVPFEDFLRTIAVARIMMPKSRVRLSAGRNTLSSDEQRQCFEVGANSIFIGEKLLTAPNFEVGTDAVALQ